MNYLAHLFLARPTTDSHLGNLLGDFCRGLDTRVYSSSILAALDNHRLVDKFTDHHPQVKQAKQQFSRQYRRFAGIALDVLFDHYLLRHWADFSAMTFDEFSQQAYHHLEQGLPMMPPDMQRVIGNMIEHQWLTQYHHLEGVGQALDRVASRIRFDNPFSGSIVEIERHYTEFEQCFRLFFPALIEHVATYSPERPAAKAGFSVR